MSAEAASQMMTTDVVVIVGAILGAAAATLFPYWSKLRENPDLLFERKFLGTAIISVVGSAAIAIGLFPSLLEQANQAGSTVSQGAVFAMTALTSFGLTRASNMVMPSGAATQASRAAATANTTATTAAGPSTG